MSNRSEVEVKKALLRHLKDGQGSSLRFDLLKKANSGHSPSVSSGVYRFYLELLQERVFEEEGTGNLSSRNVLVRLTRPDYMPLQQGYFRPRKQVLRNVCKRGIHTMTPDNTYVRPSTQARLCRECMRLGRKFKPGSAPTLDSDNPLKLQEYVYLNAAHELQQAEKSLQRAKETFSIIQEKWFKFRDEYMRKAVERMEKEERDADRDTGNEETESQGSSPGSDAAIF